MQKKRVIGLDLDDVLLNFHDSLHMYHNEKYDTDFNRNHSHTFDIHNIWGCSKEESEKRIVDFYNTELHWNSSPIEHAPESVRKLKDNNSLVIITSRPDWIKEKTIDWVEKHYPNIFDHIFFTNQFNGNGKVVTKAQACKDFGVETFVDDHIFNALNVAENGINTLLFNTPWNQSAPKHPKITRVYGWKDILNRLDPIKVKDSQVENVLY